MKLEFSANELYILYEICLGEEPEYEYFVGQIPPVDFDELMKYEMEEPDTDSGSFDSEKGAMTDFEIYITEKATGRLYKGMGGYYCRGTIEFQDTNFEEVLESETPLSQVLLLDNMFNDVAEDGYVELELAKKTALQFYKRLTHGN